MAVLDEPFRGTNVHDAAEATLAVLMRLAGHPAADVTDDVPGFDYRLRAGVSSQRIGMTLLRQEGVLELLAPLHGASTLGSDET